MTDAGSGRPRRRQVGPYVVGGMATVLLLVLEAPAAAAVSEATGLPGGATTAVTLGCALLLSRSLMRWVVGRSSD